MERKAGKCLWKCTATNLRNKHFFESIHCEHISRSGTSDFTIHFFRHVLQRLNKSESFICTRWQNGTYVKTVHCAIRQQHGRVVFVHNLAADATDNSRVHMVAQR